MDSMVFISGAAGGFGRVISVECAKRGYSLFLTDVKEMQIETLRKSLQSAYNVKIETSSCDMSNMESRTILFKKMAERGLRFWMIINVAGMCYEGSFINRTRDEIASIVRVNVESTLDIIRVLLELRDDSKTLRIINVCSFAGFYSMPFMATYAATKASLINMSIALSNELSHINATVTALCPTGMPTNKESCCGIEAQGFMGRITTLNTSVIAANTINNALKGKTIYIPGFINRILYFISQLIPSTFITHAIGLRWKNSYNKRIP